MFRRSAFLGVLLISLTGCASALQYHPARGSAGDGYSDTKIQEGVYSVQYRGRSDADIKTVSDYALLRSADITLTNGYRYFTVLTEKEDSKKMDQSLPEPARIGCIGRHCFDSYYTVWQTYTYSVPGIYFMIRCYKEEPADSPVTVFDAQQVKANIEKDYGLAQTAGVSPK